MRYFLRALLLVIVLVNPVFAQKKLTNSRTSGYYTYIYKLTDKEAFEVASKSQSVITDKFLHTLVDSFYNDHKKPYDKKLPYGHYLHVKAAQSKLVYDLHPISNVNLQFINNRKDFQFLVTDLKGNLISNANVRTGKGKNVKYDQALKLYASRTGSRNGVIRVHCEGVNNYFTYEQEEMSRLYKGPSYFKRLFKKKDQAFKNQKSTYKGYLVFNKPMYKPLDTVKFKAYLVTETGNPLRNKPLRIELYKEWNGPGTPLQTLNPYRDGGYESSFVLADSLQLKPDQNYTLVLKEQEKSIWQEVYRGGFRYEDYELKSVNFSVRTDQEEHRPGSPVSVFLKATDENELAVPDGRVELTLTSNRATKFYHEKVFINDSLWKTNIILDPVGETKLVLPDSIFPKADLDFSMNFKFLNSNNESRSAYKSLKYKFTKETIKPLFVKDSLKLDYLVQGKSVRQNATIYTSFENSWEKDSVKVLLPATIKLDYDASDYFIKVESGYQDYVFLEDLKPGINLSASHQKDSLYLVVNNEHKIPFWYTVFSGDRVFLKGYSSGRLDTLIKHKRTQAAHIRINYLWNGRELNQETSAVYSSQLLNVKLLSPDLVFPGQTVNMVVKVTDVDNQPVASTDVTVYGYTSKFKNATDVSLPDFGKRFQLRKQSPPIQADDLSLSGDMTLNWEVWGKQLGLDTIQYYQFVQTKGMYAIAEDTKDFLTLVAPFVVKDGKIEPVHIVYIDGIPVYFDQAEQLQRYAFQISPGKHRIGLRTTGFMIRLDDYEFLEGKKTILSVAADRLNKKAGVEVETSTLSAFDSSQLASYMIGIRDNFKEQKTVLQTDRSVFLLNPPPVFNRNKDLLVGPIAENYLNFKSGPIDQTFIKEPGYIYTSLPGLLKQKSMLTAYGFNRDLSFPAGSNIDYKQYPLDNDEIDSIWNEYLNLRSHTTTLFNNGYNYNKTYGKLQMRIDTAISNRLPYVKNILIYKYNQPDFLKVYPGNSTYFSPLEADKYRIMYLFRDNRYFLAEAVDIKAGGLNYFEWKDFQIKPADVFSLRIDQQIKSARSNGQSNSFLIEDQISENLNETYFDTSKLNHIMRGRVTDEKNRLALPGVSVKIKGLEYGVVTGIDGSFEIKVPSRGKLILSYIGYDSKEINASSGNAGNFTLKASLNSLEEVVVVGYGTQMKKNLTGSAVTINEMLQGRVAGVNFGAPGSSAMITLRGNSSLPAGQNPLIFVDGLPFNGGVNSIDVSSILEMSVLNGEEAIAIYGSRAVNGVVLIKTKAGNLQLNAAAEMVAQQQTMRTNFSDYAIWQPQLFTDAEGSARFTVKFPDDITNWTTKLIGMNGRKQGGLSQTNIRSFKTLSANFVSPQFALEGDRIKVIGKLMNYSNKEENVTRTFSYNGTVLLNNEVKYKNSKIDTVAIFAKGMGNSSEADSLKFEYTLKQKNGYFDGEIRKIPLMKAGVMETKGQFNALIRDTAVTYHFAPGLGKVTLRAESSVFPVLLDEMEKIRSYEYLCNEQLASKLKALLLEKTVRKYLAEDFKSEKNIKDLLKQLQNNKLPGGTWGWWQNSNEELWVSLHAVEALLQAQKQGYTINLDKDKLHAYLINQLANRSDNDQIYTLKILHLLDEKFYIKDWIVALEKKKAELEKRDPYKESLYERLSILKLKQDAGLPVDFKWLLDLKKNTMFGNSYWGEQNNLFWDNSVQNTLLAYQILRKEGKYRAELDRIQRYFFEQKIDGQWRNTYESSLILETLLPELMTADKKHEPASIVLNKKEKVTAFPFNKVIDPNVLNVEKTGDAPVYFTAYQQFNNPAPEKVNKDFKLRSWFDQDGGVVQKLKAGKMATLKVEVEVRADADYVMIEIPIPAGCSYENKLQSFWGIETHRSYFKHKTSIFCTKLKQGKYSFSIQLMPRYSGDYILNPAKAEMMYFPVFYGREGLKRVSVN